MYYLSRGPLARNKAASKVISKMNMAKTDDKRHGRVTGKINTGTYTKVAFRGIVRFLHSRVCS